MKNNYWTLEKIVGLLFTAPPLMGVVFFVYSVFDKNKEGKISQLKHLGADWTGGYDTGGYTSAAPLYLGLMAIAGAILLSKGESLELNAGKTPTKTNT